MTSGDRNQFHPWPKADHHCPKWCKWWSLRDHRVYLTTFSLHAEKSEPTCHRKEKGGHPNVSPAWRCLDTSRLTNTCYLTTLTVQRVRSMMEGRLKSLWKKKKKFVMKCKYVNIDPSRTNIINERWWNNFRSIRSMSRMLLEKFTDLQI